MQKIEEGLYFDPQKRKPIGKCRRCGGWVYPPGSHCPRCERRQV